MSDLSNGPAGGLTGWLTMQEGLSPVIDRNARLGAYLRDQPLIQAQQQAQTQGQYAQNQAQQFTNANAPTMMQAQLNGSPFQQQQFAQTANQQAIQNQMAQQNASRQMALEEETQRRNAEFMRHNMATEQNATNLAYLQAKKIDPFEDFLPPGTKGTSPTEGTPSTPQAQQTQPTQQAAQGPLDTKSPELADDPSWNHDALNAMPIKKRAIITEMISGKIPPPTGAAWRNPTTLSLLADAQTVDPNFSLTTWGVRNSTAKDFGSGGVSGRRVTAANTLAMHLGGLAQTLDKLDNTDMPVLTAGTPVTNAVMNKISPTFQANYGVAKKYVDAVSSELMKLYGGSQGSEREIQAWRDGFSLDQSPTAMKAGLAGAVHLVDGVLYSLDDSYKRGMKSNRTVLDLISPQARKVFNALGSNYVRGQAGQQEPQQQMGQQGQTQAPQQGQTLSKSGKPMHQENGQWVYD